MGKINLTCGNMTLTKVDEKGRITIPKEAREKFRIKDNVNITVEEEAVIIKPAKDPYEKMKNIIVKSVNDVAAETRKLKKITEKEALKAVKERWP